MPPDPPITRAKLRPLRQHRPRNLDRGRGRLVLLPHLRQPLAHRAPVQRVLPGLRMYG